MDTSAVNFTVHACSAGHLVGVYGEVDVAAAPLLAETLAQFSNGDVLVDLGAVDFLDSSGLNALLAAHRHIERRGGHLVVRDASPIVLKVLEITGLDGVLHFSDSEQKNGGVHGSEA